MSHNEAKALMAALAAVFAPSEVKFKPGVISGNRALALIYVDARAVQDRLDDVLGIDGWQDQYTPLPDGSVVCELRCRIGEEWIVKTDVGSPSEQPDGGDRLKAGFSDALKRAAVKFGIGRYLYRLPALWVDYDPQKRKFARTPELPREATSAGRKQTSAGREAPGANGGTLPLAGRPFLSPATTANAGANGGTLEPVAGGTVTDEERAALAVLLARKNKTVKAALKSAGSPGRELADLTRDQYQLLVSKLEKLPDVGSA